MMRRALTLGAVAVLALTLAGTFAPEPGRVSAQSIELTCPSGSVPDFFAGSVTRNPTTDGVRYNFCVDSSGKLIYQGTGGGPAVSAVDLTAQAADISNTAILTPSADGFYRASAYIVITQAATTSASLPGVAILFTDANSGQAETIPLTAGLADNLLGSTGPAPTPNAGQGQFVFGFYAKGGVSISYHTSGYASSGATPMQFALHIRLEGPF